MDVGSFKPLGSSQIAEIGPVPLQTERPLWSVMIPTFNCARYLRQTLESVLSQDLGPDKMQIEVVDDASTLDDPQAVVEEFGRGRVSFFRKPSNEGATKNFNTCIERSKGLLIHILHGDDLVAPGYYQKVTQLAKLHPELGLYAARCFFIDEDTVITGVTPRITELEKPGRGVSSFFYLTPIQFAGITVRRSCYESLGGFRLDLVHAADCEMWARIVAAFGGVILSDVLGFYRLFTTNDTGRLLKTGDNVRDVCRLNQIFSANYPEFSTELARARASKMAWRQYDRFRLLGEQRAAAANHLLWVQLTPFRKRLVQNLKRLIRPLVVHMRNYT